jgi:hypothetical protein
MLRILKIISGYCPATVYEVDTNSEASPQRFKDDLAALGVLNPKRLKGRYDFRSDTFPT